jgi:serine/threonine protein kinase
VYALGAILYECLTGRPPFRAETATATLRQVVEEEPVPPARLNPRVPRDPETSLRAIICSGPTCGWWSTSHGSIPSGERVWKT